MKKVNQKEDFYIETFKSDNIAFCIKSVEILKKYLYCNKNPSNKTPGDVKSINLFQLIHF